MEVVDVPLEKKYAGRDPAFNVEVRSEGLVKLSIHSAMRWAKLRSGGRLHFRVQSSNSEESCIVGFHVGDRAGHVDVKPKWSHMVYVVGHSSAIPFVRIA